ncbi:evbL [Mycolicibacterium sp.]|uniref:SCO6745 family protein n=1 Tax=Mycolicibacterium sp. TaxID=2320850 RepID=UPI0025F626E7|nr:evbL [Mycolicibacterium sp.]
MSNADMLESAREAGGPIEASVATFMLHPETFAESIAAGYENPFAGYVAGRGGVLGEANGSTVATLFVIFEPNFLAGLWDEGVKVRGAAAAADLYWEQTAGFGRRHLADAEGLNRLAALGEKVIAVAPTQGLALYSGWRRMPLADDAAARALQVMFVLRELRGDIHLNALTISGIEPIEAHMLNKGHEYATMFGWPEPFLDGAAKKGRYDEVEALTNRRIAELFDAALTTEEAKELARLAAAALATIKASSSA